MFISGTLAQELQLKEVIAARKEQPGCLMPVLQQHRMPWLLTD